VLLLFRTQLEICCDIVPIGLSSVSDDSRAEAQGTAIGCRQETTRVTGIGSQIGKQLLYKTLSLHAHQL